MASKLIASCTAFALTTMAATFADVQIAHATDSDSATCALVDPARGGTARDIPSDTNMTITVVEGESITITTSDGLPINYFSPTNGTLASGVPLLVTAATAGDFTFSRPNRVGMPPASISCAGAISGGSNSAAQDAVTSIIVNSNTSSMAGAIGDAVDGALGSGGASGYIAQNGFSLSTRGAAKLLNSNSASAAKGLKEKTETGVYGADVDLNSVPQSTPWNIWATGRYDHFDGDNNAFDGHVANLIVGADYKISETMLIGLLGGYSSADIDTLIGGTAGSVEADGLTIGAYFGAQLEGSLVANGFVAYTASDYNVVNGASTGSFDADRISAGATLYGSMPMEGFVVQPTVSFIISSEDQDAYVDSGANAIASNDITSGRVSLGPKVIFDATTTENGEISPWIAVNYDYDFSDSDTPVTTGAPDLGDVSSASVELGLISKIGRAELTGSGRVGGLGSGEYTSYGGSLKIRIPLD